VAGQLWEILSIRDGYGPDDYSDFHRYEFDIARPDLAMGDWQSVEVRVQLSAAEICIDNLTVWASDDPCFDCSPPKLALYDPVPEPGGWVMLMMGVALIASRFDRGRSSLQ